LENVVGDTGGVEAKLIIDGTTTFDLDDPKAGGTPGEIAFGRATDDSAKSQWSGVEYVIPEPATLSVLVLGAGLALIRRRR